MDISKASNFERFIFDLVGRDPDKVRELWAKVAAGGAFDLSGTPYWANIAQYGFTSGSSSHADRLTTIRQVWEQYNILIDTHTADGVKVAQEQIKQLPEQVALLVLETAQPAKFAETIQEAIGQLTQPPKGLEHLEDLSQRVEVIDPDVNVVKAFIQTHLQRLTYDSA